MKKVSEIEPLVKLEEAAEILRRSHWMLRRDIKSGKIRALRIGGRLFIEPDEIRRLIGEYRQGAVAV